MFGQTVDGTTAAHLLTFTKPFQDLAQQVTAEYGKPKSIRVAQRRGPLNICQKSHRKWLSSWEYPQLALRSLG